MVKELFVSRDFKPDTLTIIDQANTIIDEYREQGFTLTLRQLFYQYVSRDLIRNLQSEYKRLGSILNDARLAGLVDWSAMEDRTRNVDRPSLWDSPAEILEAVGEQYKRNPWDDQTVRPEVWIEKEALAGVIVPVCDRWRVPRLSCRGYMSQSEQYAAGKRFGRYLDDGLRPVVLHLGDHDPSGLNMTEDNRDRLGMFAGADVEIRRLALNMDQVERYNPPPNPAKETDSRFTGYESQFGDKCWELDALDPRTIDQLIDREIRGLIDRNAWDKVMAAEKIERKVLAGVADRFDDVADFLGEAPEESDDD
jgi:hypothetical protein